MALEIEGDTEEDEAVAHVAEVGFKQRPPIGKGKGKGKQKQRDQGRRRKRKNQQSGGVLEPRPPPGRFFPRLVVARLYKGYTIPPPPPNGLNTHFFTTIPT